MNRLAGMMTMGKLVEILGLLSMRNAGKQTALIHEFLSHLAVVLSLIIISGMMVGVLLVGSLYAFYHVVMSYGLEQDAALCMTAGIAILLTILTVSMAISHFRRLASLPGQIFNARSPAATKAGGVVNAFVDGLMGETTPKPAPASRPSNRSRAA